jgi:opacity protein-like surface antigen
MGSKMKKILAFILLFTFSGAACALEPKKGFLINISGGYTPSILNTDGGVFQGGYVGYKFNPMLSVEAGYTSLLNQARSGATTTETITGPEFAGILTLPINDRVATFVRVGFTKMADKVSTSGNVTSIQNIYGPSYGLGLQFYETENIALRVGYNAYELQTNNDYFVQAGTPVNTSNAYAALIILF